MSLWFVAFQGSTPIGGPIVGAMMARLRRPRRPRAGRGHRRAGRRRRPGGAAPAPPARPGTARGRRRRAPLAVAAPTARAGRLAAPRNAASLHAGMLGSLLDTALDRIDRRRLHEHRLRRAQPLVGRRTTLRSMAGKRCSSPAPPPDSAWRRPRASPGSAPTSCLVARDAAARRARPRPGSPSTPTAAQARLELCDLAAAEPRCARSRERLIAAAATASTCSSTTPASCPSERTLTDGRDRADVRRQRGRAVPAHPPADRPLRRQRRPSRIITVSSGGMYAQRLHADDLQNAHGEFSGDDRLCPHQARRGDPHRDVGASGWPTAVIVAHAMHPGWADTPGVSASLPRFYRLTRPLLRSPAQGADTIVWLGAADEPAAQHRRLLARPPAPPDVACCRGRGERAPTARRCGASASG